MGPAALSIAYTSTLSHTQRGTNPQKPTTVPHMHPKHKWKVRLERTYRSGYNLILRWIQLNKHCLAWLTWAFGVRCMNEVAFSLTYISQARFDILTGVYLFGPKNCRKYFDARLCVLVQAVYVNIAKWWRTRFWHTGSCVFNIQEIISMAAFWLTMENDKRQRCCWLLRSDKVGGYARCFFIYSCRCHCQWPWSVNQTCRTDRWTDWHIVVHGYFFFYDMGEPYAVQFRSHMWSTSA